MTPPTSWTHADVLGALLGPRAAVPGVVKLNLEDLAVPLGVGMGIDDRVCVLVPPGEAVEAYEGKRANFRPRTAVMPESAGAKGVDAGVLTFSADAAQEDVLSAIASAIVGLFDVVRRGDAAQGARAASGLARLIDRGYLRAPSRSAIEGVMGELLVILRASDPVALLAAWHREPEAPFDFSTGTCRLEVKATATGLRTHDFSSRQLSEAAIPTDIASVLLMTAEAGATLADLVEKVAEHLGDGPSHDTLRRNVEEIIGVPVEMAERPQIDIAASIASIHLWSSELIPQPIATEGVNWIRWEAHLPAEPKSREVPTELAQALEGPAPA
jgi:hypothetical protein